MQTLLLPFIHFAALLGFVVYKTKTPFGQFVRSRHEEVVTGLNRSKTQATDATQRKIEIEAKLAGLEFERQAILAEWKERETQQIQALKESSQRILAQIKADAELNKKALEEGFRAETVRAFGLLVLAKAEDRLKATMTPELHKKLNQGFINELMGA